MSKRRLHHPEFKVKVALEALKGEEMVSELASRLGIQMTFHLQTMTRLGLTLDPVLRSAPDVT